MSIFSRLFLLLVMGAFVIGLSACPQTQDEPDGGDTVVIEESVEETADDAADAAQDAAEGAQDAAEDAADAASDAADAADSAADQAGDAADDNQDSY